MIDIHFNCREFLLKTEWDHLTTVWQIWLWGTWYWVRNATATWHAVLVQPDSVFLVQICFWQINFVSGYMPLGYGTVIICPNHTRSAWKCKASKEKSSVSAYSWLNFYIWMVLSFTGEEQYLWNSSPRSQPVVTGCLDLISCSWYSPIFANCSVQQMPAPTHVGVTAVLHECRICPYKITPPTVFVFCGAYSLDSVQSAV